MDSSDLFEKVAVFFSAHLPSAPQSLGIAVSGGGDSVALFHILFRLRQRLGVGRLALLHADHHLRGKESDGDAAFVKDLARQYGVAFFGKDLQCPPQNGIEEWARKERYEFFSAIKKAEGLELIATGHTADDQAETVLLRMMRGCGLKGLCAIEPVREDGIIRPLLYVSREQLRTWLGENSLDFREDSSNSDTRYRRNWVRHELMPLLAAEEPGAVGHIANLADHASAAWGMLRPDIEKWIAENVAWEGPGRFTIRKNALSSSCISREAVAELFRQKGIRFDRLHCESVLTNSQKNSGIFLLPGGWGYECSIDGLCFVNGIAVLRDRKGKRGREDFFYELAVPGVTVCDIPAVIFECAKYRSEDLAKPAFDPDNRTVYLDADAVGGGGLEFRPLRQKEMFQPLGSPGPRDAEDFLKKQKAPPDLRRARGVVATKKGEIVWIPGVRIGQGYRLTEQTRAILKIFCGARRAGGERGGR